MELIAPEIVSSDETYGPISRKYDKIDKRYRFSRRPSALPLHYYYPASLKSQASRSGCFPRCFSNSAGDRNYRRKVHPPFTECCLSSNLQNGEVSGKAASAKRSMDSMSTAESYSDSGSDCSILYLPDTVLLLIFEYCHPLDIVHSFGRVCMRWNKIAQPPSLYKEIRVIVNEDTLSSGCITRLFEKVSKVVKRLCIECLMDLPSDKVENLFSYKMPSLVELDVGSFKLIWKELADKFVECFPNIERFNMENAEIVGSLSDLKTSGRETLEVLFQDSTFKNLRCLALNLYPSDAPDENESGMHPFHTLRFEPSGLRNLQILHIDCSEALFWRGNNTITELYFGGRDVPGGFLFMVGQLTNLKVLSFALKYNTSDHNLLQLKPLRKLEALHLYVGGGEDGEISQQGLINFFMLPEENPYKFFPYSLKYLAVLEAWDFREEALQELGKSCPSLVALNLSGAAFMGNSVLRIIARCFPQMMFLNLSSMGEYNDGAIDKEFTQLSSIRLMELNDDELPNLACLIVHDHMVNRKAVERLCSKRKDLIVSTTPNNFVSWKVTDAGTDYCFEYTGDINSLMNDLCDIPGFELAMYSMTSYHAPIDDLGRRIITRVASLDGPDRDQLPNLHGRIRGSQRARSTSF